MTRLELVQEIDLPPAMVWRYLTEPDLMNQWSSARIELVDLGDEDRADGVGAMRAVHLSAGPRKLRLDEVVQRSDAPSHFVYRVLRTPWISTHHGDIAIKRTPPGGSRIVWTVEFEMTVPGIGMFVQRALERDLGASLAKLAEIARPIDAVVPSRSLADEADVELWRAAEEVLAAQRGLADRLERAGDPKRWFSRVYQYVTENQLAWAKQRKTVHLGWVLRLIPAFHRIYFDNFEKRLEGQRCESQWRSAFDAMEGKIGRRRHREEFRIGYGLLKGVQAHIEEDLPRALARVWAEHYAGRCDYVRFRADYLTMSGIFDDATERLAAQMPKEMTPWYADHLPRELKEAWRRRKFYDVAKARRLAFERGARIAEMLTDRSGPGSSDLRA